MSAIAKSARSALALIATFGVSTIDRIILTGVMLRLWGTDRFSDWTTLTAATALLAVCELGFQVYLGNMLSRAHLRGRRRVFNRIVGWGITFYLGLFCLIVLGCGVLVLSTDLRTAFALRTMDGRWVFLLLALYQGMRLTRTSLTQVMRGRGELHLHLWTDVRVQVAIMAAVIAAMFLGASPVVVAAIYGATEIVIGTLWTIGAVRRRYPDVPIRPRAPGWAATQHTARNLGWYGTQTLVTNGMLNLPVLVAAWLGMTGPAVAAFVTQRTLVNFGRTLCSTLSMAAGVELANLSQTRADASYRTGVYALARFNAGFAALMTGGLIIFGNDIMAAWTGVPDLGSRVMLLTMLVPVAVMAPVVPLQMVSLYAGFPRPQAIGGIVQAVIGLVTCVVFGQWFGIVGVVAGVALGEVVGQGIVFPLLAARRLQVPFAGVVLSSLIVFVGGLAWSWGVGLLAVRGGQDGLVGFLVALAVWGVLGALPVILACLPASVWRRLPLRRRRQ